MQDRHGKPYQVNAIDTVYGKSSVTKSSKQNDVFNISMNDWKVLSGICLLYYYCIVNQKIRSMSNRSVVVYLEKTETPWCPAIPRDITFFFISIKISWTNISLAHWSTLAQTYLIWSGTHCLDGCITKQDQGHLIFLFHVHRSIKPIFFDIHHLKFLRLF
jgi:hypothetical protein